MKYPKPLGVINQYLERFPRSIGENKKSPTHGVLLHLLLANSTKTIDSLTEIHRSAVDINR
jgi:hypothetical protein